MDGKQAVISNSPQKYKSLSLKSHFYTKYPPEVTELSAAISKYNQPNLSSQRISRRNPTAKLQQRSLCLWVVVKGLSNVLTLKLFAMAKTVIKLILLCKNATPHLKRIRSETMICDAAKYKQIFADKKVMLLHYQWDHSPSGGTLTRTSSAHFLTALSLTHNNAD
ncbi:hypothetical protein ACTXT7_000812 [Hymenolepis weldensis]